MAAFKDKFGALTKEKTTEQCKFFCQRFVFRLGDRYGEVKALEVKFSDALKNDDGKLDSMSPAVAADFFQKQGRTRTAAQRKAELADVDANGDGRTSFIEYLLLHFKIMILEEFFERKGTPPDVSMDDDGVGLTGVGDRLIEELYAPPAGLDPELEKMMRDFSLEHQTRKVEIASLEDTVAAGGVKGLSAKNTLEALKKKDSSDMNAVEARIAAAIKKAEKKTIEAVTAKEAEIASAAQAALAGHRLKT